MKKIFWILCLLSVVSCGDNDNKQPAQDNSEDLARAAWKSMTTNIAGQEFNDCLTYGATEFKSIKSTEIEKTCRCVIDALYFEETKDSNGNIITDRFSFDFRTFLKNKCGKNVPSHTLRDIPEWGKGN